MRNRRIRAGIKSAIQKRREAFKKGITLVPHLFTLGNAFFGFCSLILAARGEWVSSAHFILLGALMDALDGRVARFIGSAGGIGVHLDSLSDLLTFCVAPAFLVYLWQLKSFGFLGVGGSAIFFLAGMLRLARFNMIHDQQTLFFLGLPTTIAGCFIVAVLLNGMHLGAQRWFVVMLFGLMCLLAMIMTSRIPFPAFKQRLFKDKKNWQVLLVVVCFAIGAIFRLKLLLLLLLGSYITFGLGKAAIGSSLHT